MNKLQKAAWFNLAVGAGTALIAGLCFAVLTKMNAKGIDHILIFFIVACVLTPIVYMLYRKKSFEAGFDERERMIYRRAFALSAWVLMAFLAGICIVPFFILGGQNAIRVYYLPLIFASTLFTAQFAHSVAILVQCGLEDEDGR
jgi:uncharacterized membrane protein YhdT